MGCLVIKQAICTQIHELPSMNLTKSVERPDEVPDYTRHNRTLSCQFVLKMNKVTVNSHIISGFLYPNSLIAFIVKGIKDGFTVPLSGE